MRDALESKTNCVTTNQLSGVSPRGLISGNYPLPPKAVDEFCQIYTLHTKDSLSRDHAKVKALDFLTLFYELSNKGVNYGQQ